MTSKYFLGYTDISVEILKYYEVSLESDEEQAVKEKRKTALAIALLSCKVVELGLNILWRSMSTVEPIVTVINSRHDDEGTFLEYCVGDGRTYWRLTSPPKLFMQRKLCDRILSYLTRIRKFHIQLNGKELELWQMLSALLRPNSITHFLPRLQTLCLTSAADTTTLPFLGCVSHLLAPTLTSITVRGKWDDAWNTIEYLIDSHELPRLSELIYWNNGTPNFPTGVQRFTGLQHLVVYDSHHFDDLSSLLELRPLQQLEDLHLRFGTNQGDLPLSPTPAPVFFPKLQNLHLETGLESDIDTFFRHVKCPDLVRLSLGYWSACKQKLPLDSMVAACPGLQELIIRFRELELHSYQMIVDDLAPIIEVRGIRSLRLLDVPHRLREKDAVSMMESWPGLRTLTIIDPKSEATFPATILITASSFPALRHINLPLDFSLLTDPLPAERTLQSRSQLLEIKSSRSSGIPTRMFEKLALVWNLLRLFPNLNKISGKEESIIHLQEAFAAVHKFFKPRSELAGPFSRPAEN